MTFLYCCFHFSKNLSLGTYLTCLSTYIHKWLNHYQQRYIDSSGSSLRGICIQRYIGPLIYLLSFNLLVPFLKRILNI
uniref:Uncharacterized protein n=1 Tax=Solanum lycopersicum TaxID=4081 RepID=A0A3Q7I6F3_SOLLC